MCACLGAVVRAPVTGILIVFEMTHQFSIILPLMLGVLVSHSISRRLAPVSFYDALLEQDGHHLTRIIPPRDFESWQQLPVSTIANFHPVSLAEIDPATLRETLARHPYSNFPVVKSGRLSGVLTRKEIERSLLMENDVVPEPAVTAQPAENIGVIQGRLIQSGAGVIALCDRQESLLGIVTLHDLIRAQMAYGGGLDKDAMT
jgi:CIC family chloride channel protein